MTDDVAAAWIDLVTSRGVAIEARGTRVVLHPKQSFSLLSVDERATLKQHKLAIVEVVRTRHHGWARPAPRAPAATAASVSATASAVPSAPVYCGYCMRAPCCGVDHDAYATLHERDPQAYWILRERLRAKDNEEFLLRRVHGARPHQW